mmetsp:Transcript_1784/g.2939  ORF Transcript_1784/g.2939 Transcript_1784/m.2939 type:complete len:117 (+) Transcript_1784:934-1284(+)
MEELGVLREEARGLEIEVDKYCDILVKKGTPTLKMLHELAQCYKTLEAYRDARQALATTQQVLELLEKAEEGLVRGNHARRGAGVTHQSDDSDDSEEEQEEQEKRRREERKRETKQ